MNFKNIKKCPKCGQKLYRNGQRNGKQRWRCKSKFCKYNFTENLNTPNIKKNAVTFFYDFMKNISKYKAKLDNSIIENTIRKTEYSYQDQNDYKISIEDVSTNLTIKANSFIVEMNEDELKLLSLRYYDKDLLFKRNSGKFKIEKYKKTTDQVYDDYNSKYFYKKY